MGEEAVNLEIDDQQAPEAQPAPEAEQAESEQESEPEAKQDEAAAEEDDGSYFDDNGNKYVPQKKVNEIVSKTAGRYLPKIEELQNQLQTLQQQLSSQQPQQQDPQRPAIPPMPDPFDDDFTEKMQARDKAVQEATRYDFEQQVRQQQQQAEQQARQQAAMQGLQETAQAYSERAKKLGIKADELKIAGQQLGAAGLDANMVMHILQDEVGPKITTYLAQNYSELEKVKAMSPLKAAVYLENVIKPKATQKKGVQPPPPAGSVRGSGAAERIGPKGLVIE